MSNKLSIQQEEVTVRHTGSTSKQVALFDNYAQTVIETEVEFDDGLELLKWVIEQAVAKNNVDAIGLLDFVFMNQAGIQIESDWYDWEQLHPVFAGADAWINY